MKIQSIAFGIMAIGVIATWNSWLFVEWNSASTKNTWQNPPNNIGNTVTTPEPKLWVDIKKTSVEETPDGGFEPKFDESVVAAEGKQVELPGVGFLLSSGLRENEKGEEEVTEFLLLPGDGGVAWCCGLSAIPHAEISVLVECPDSPFLKSKADPKSSTVFVKVKGTLRLMKKSKYNAFYTLEDAAIEFIDLEDVMPTSVMNACLNRPMVP